MQEVEAKNARRVDEKSPRCARGQQTSSAVQTLQPAEWIPDKIVLDGYINPWSKFTMGRFYANTIFLVVMNTVLTESVMEATDLPRSVASSSYSAVRFLGGAAAPPLAALE